MRRALAHSISAATSRGDAADRGRGAGGRMKRDLAVEQLGGTHVALGPAGPELGVGDGVERAGGDRVPQPETAQPAGELDRRLAGEGHGEDLAGVVVADRHPVGDASGQHPRLARAGAGEDAQAPSLAVTAASCSGLSPSRARSGSSWAIGADPIRGSDSAATMRAEGRTGRPPGYGSTGIRCRRPLRGARRRRARRLAARRARGADRQRGGVRRGRPPRRRPTSSGCTRGCR